MSIITFTDDGVNQTGKTLSTIAIATYMALEQNHKILIISTAYKNKVLERAFFKEDIIPEKNMGIFGPNTSQYTDYDIEGLATLMRANSLTPELLPNYTKKIIDGKFEILKSYSGEIAGYNELKDKYFDIITMADQYYDLVFVDLETSIGQDNYNKIIENSALIVNVIGQGLNKMAAFDDFREKNPIFKSPKTILLIGRYDKYSKTNIKYITKALHEKNKILAVPYCTLFFEACDESTVLDLFYRLRQVVDPEDRNHGFVEELKRCSDNIIYRLQDLQMRR